VHQIQVPVVTEQMDLYLFGGKTRRFNMKKVFLALLGILLATSLVFAAADNKTIISSTTLDDDPTSVTSSTFNIQDYEKVAFFVSYDETEVGNSVSIAITLDVSYDGSNWIDASFYDYGGGTTFQTTESLTADGWYVCWFEPDLNVPYVRMVITATNTDSDDLAVVTAYLAGVK